ncbi:MAG: hypothetical protein LBQ54_14630 [Planctomycetaceae bacterium]|jgi:hypothetical protein|nr:hypothetical protein [Planctomycetaceae bacterium]
MTPISPVFSYWEHFLSGKTAFNLMELARLAESHPEDWRKWRKQAALRAEKLNLDAYSKSLWALPSLMLDMKLQGEYGISMLLDTITLLPESPLPKKEDEEDASHFSTALTDCLFHAEKVPVSFEENAWLYQLIRGELPWLLACLFPDSAASDSLLTSAKECFQTVFREVTDGEGLPKASDYRLLLPLLASWTRVLMLGKNARISPWGRKEQSQFEWAVLQALRFHRRDGASVFDSSIGSMSKSFADKMRKSCMKILRTALTFDKDMADHAAAKAAFPRLTLQETQTDRPARLPEAAYFSEWSQMAQLRTKWPHNAPSLSVAFAPVREFPGDEFPGLGTAADAGTRNHDITDNSVRTELNLAGKTLWSGTWNTVLRQNGQILKPADPWVMTCSVSDGDADYLELELRLTCEMRLQRHFLLAHKERLLLLADTLLFQKNPLPEEDAVPPDETFDLEYEAGLLLARETGVQADSEASELLLLHHKTPLARVFPLFLPEWKKTPHSAGSLTAESQMLKIRRRNHGVGLFVPLIFDLAPNRLKLPYTWRQLTVGENRQIVGQDRAAAFRLQTGKLHTLLYRSITPAANRTFFGHNLVSEFFFGRFDPKTGEVEVLMAAEEAA